MTDHFDVIIIGGGNAGFAVSSAANRAGLTTAFIEAREFGGTCPNRGCTPKKVLVAAGHALDEIERASAHGISVGPADIDWPTLIDRTADMIGFIPGAMRGVAEKRATVFEGEARFVDEQTVEVGDTRLTGEHIVIATGSKARPLPIPGAEHLATSDDLLVDRERPERIIFVGGGVISLEFGHVFRRAGSEITILEVLPRLLPALDADAVDVLHADAERLGIGVHTSVSVNEIAKDGDEYVVRAEIDGNATELRADRVVNGAGASRTWTRSTSKQPA